MKHWSQFWKSSVTLSSFAESAAADGYSHEIKEFWLAAVEKATEDAVMVDIGTGNGALAVLLNDACKEQKKSWQIHGIDAAEIDPSALEEKNEVFKGRFEGIQFYPKTQMHETPFQASSVDYLVGQFAFEYGDQAKTLAEAARILKPQGRAIFMIHHTESPVHASCLAGIQVIQHLVLETPLFMQADLYLRAAAQGLKTMSLEAFQQTLEGRATGKTVEWLLEYAQQSYQQEEAKAWVTDIGRRVINLLSQVKNSAEAEQGIRTLNLHYQLLTSNLLRLKDMVNAAKTEKEIKALLIAAQEVGFSGFHSEFKQASAPFAWQVQLEKHS